MRKILFCREYDCLGVIIDDDAKHTKDIKRRIEQGRIAVRRLNEIWKNMLKRITLRMYDTIVKSI